MKQTKKISQREYDAKGTFPSKPTRKKVGTDATFMPVMLNLICNFNVITILFVYLLNHITIPFGKMSFD